MHRRCKRLKLVQHHTRFLFIWSGHHVDLTQSSACALSTCYRTELSKVERSDMAFRVSCGDVHMGFEFGGSLDEYWAWFCRPLLSMRGKGGWNAELTQVPDFLDWDRLRCRFVHDDTPVVRCICHFGGLVFAEAWYVTSSWCAFVNATKNRNGSSLMYVGCSPTLLLMMWWWGVTMFTVVVLIPPSVLKLFLYDKLPRFSFTLVAVATRHSLNCHSTFSSSFPLFPLVSLTAFCLPLPHCHITAHSCWSLLLSIHLAQLRSPCSYH